MIAIEMPTTSFEPGQQMTGLVRWDGFEAADSLTIRLMWQTSGKGDRDFCIVNQIDVDTRLAHGEQPFSFKAPSHPHSFSGLLISLVWSIEVLRSRTQEIETCNLIIAPQGREILLHQELRNS